MTIKNTIESYRKRRKQLMPLILGVAAILLVVVGIVIVVTSTNGGGLAELFSTSTPTPTITPLPTNTLPPTETPTITLTPTETSTATPSEPYTYVVQENDNLYKLVEEKNLGDYGIILIYMLNPTIDPATGFITVGQTIILPPPGYPLPTSTPLPTNLGIGSRITYRVMPGDSFGSIANQFNSTVDAIVAANQASLPDGEDTMIYPGQLLLVPINLVTAVPTSTGIATLTPTPTATATVTP